MKSAANEGNLVFTLLTFSFYVCIFSLTAQDLILAYKTHRSHQRKQIEKVQVYVKLTFNLKESCS